MRALFPGCRASARQASAVLVVCAVLAFQLLPGANASGATGAQLERYLGFRLHEERRYALGPPEVLRGEHESWLIRLEAVADASGDNGQDPGFEATFLLQHEYTQFVGNFIAPAEAQQVTATTRVIVNQFGAPLELSYRREVDGQISERDLARTMRVSFANGGYTVERPRAMGYRKTRFQLSKTRYVDPAIPKGVFVSPAENPALLSLIFALMARGGLDEIEFSALRPTLMSRSSLGVSLDSEIPRRRVPLHRAEPGYHLRYPHRMTDRYVELGEHTIIDAGNHQLQARIGEWNGQDVYFDAAGVLLRIDTQYELRPAWIRLLHPSEY